VYSSTAPAATRTPRISAAIYMYDDANYYISSSLWTDINSSAGQFPYYVNMFLNRYNPGTGYSAIGSEMLIQSGYSYQEKDGSFNDNYGINGLNWKCLPASPGPTLNSNSQSRHLRPGRDPVLPPTCLTSCSRHDPDLSWKHGAGSGLISYTNVRRWRWPLPLGGFHRLHNRRQAASSGSAGTLEAGSLRRHLDQLPRR